MCNPTTDDDVRWILRELGAGVVFCVVCWIQGPAQKQQEEGANVVPY